MLVKAIIEGKPVTVKQFVETLNDPVVLKRFEMEVKEEKFNESAKNTTVHHRIIWGFK